MSDDKDKKYLPNDAFYGGWVPFFSIFSFAWWILSFIFNLH